MKDLSKLTPVKPDQGKAQWVEGQVTGIAKDEPKRTHLIGIPPLMPCTTIFVHGMNLDDKCYHDAAVRFAEGLAATRRKVSRDVSSWLTRLLMPSVVTLLTACGLTGPFPGVPDLHSASRIRSQPVEIAPPQIAYRIDENRYFEIVPYGPGACTNAMVHFVDKAKGIRSEAVKLDRGSMLRATLIIDASNDQYLVAPVTRGNTDCSSGGGLCGGSKLPYSTDGGRTWKRANPMFSGDDIYLSGEDVYVSADGRSGQTAKLSAKPQEMESWSRFNLMKTPPKAPRKQPLDSKFHCTVNGKE